MDCVFVALFILHIHGSSCSGPDSMGTEFVVTFPFMYFEESTATPPQLYISTLSTNPVQVQLSTPASVSPYFETEVTVMRGSHQRVDVPAWLRPSVNGISDSSIMVNATEEVTVVAQNIEEYTMDAWSVYPVDTLWNNYYIITYDYTPFFQIAAVANGTTHVSIYVEEGPMQVFGTSYSRRDTFEFDLEQYQVFSVYYLENTPNHPDYSGSKITCDKPVVVTSGSVLAVVPNEGVNTADFSAEQLVAKETWGTVFAITSTPTRNSGDTCRIYSDTDRNGVDIVTSNGGSKSTSVSEGSFYEYSLGADDHAMITSDDPIAVYCFGQSWDQNTGSTYGGDPSLIYIPPVTQYTNQALFPTMDDVPGSVDSDYTHFVNLIVPTAHVDGIRWNRAPLDADTVWTALPTVTKTLADGRDITYDYSVAQLGLITSGIPEGDHDFFHVDPNVGFVVFMIGLSRWGSYGTVMGSNLPPENMACTASTAVEGDVIDNDCDGLFDEELQNGIDDDGDGLIDEDISLLPRVDGNWTAWSDWSDVCDCPVIEAISRQRNCTNPSPQGTGIWCLGSEEEIIQCCETTAEPTTEVPPEELTTEAPPEELTTEVPSEELTTEVPPEELTTEAPPEELTTEAPPEELTTEPLPEESTTQPPSEELTTEAPPEELTTEAPPEELTTEAPPEESTTQPPSEELTTEAPPEELTTEAPPEEPTTQSPPEELTTEAPPEELTTEAPPEDLTTEAPPEEPTTQPPPEELTTEAPPEELTTEALPAGESTSSFIEIVTTYPLLEQATTESPDTLPPYEQETTAPSIEELTTEPPIQEDTTESATDPISQPSVDEVTTEPPEDKSETTQDRTPTTSTSTSTTSTTTSTTTTTPTTTTTSTTTTTATTTTPTTTTTATTTSSTPTTTTTTPTRTTPTRPTVPNTTPTKPTQGTPKPKTTTTTTTAVTTDEPTTGYEYEDEEAEEDTAVPAGAGTAGAVAGAGALGAGLWAALRRCKKKKEENKVGDSSETLTPAEI